MALPEQIRKQTEAVQQLYAQLNDDAGTDSAADAVVAPAAEASAADADADTSSAAPSSATEHKSGDDSVPEDTVLQKYKTLQGMYNAEVPRLHQQNREMSQRVQQMEQLLASLSAQQSSASAAQAPASTSEQFVTDKDVEEYGESIDMMRRVSREELVAVAQRLGKIEQMLQQVQSNVVPQVQAVAQRQQATAEQQFWADLAVAVPSYRDINNDDGFQAWLLEADPLTGISRQTYLEDAQRALDSRRVANFFRAWLEKSGQATVAQPAGRTTSSELEKQMAPGRSRGAGAPASANKAKTYSPQDIQKFFNDVRSGKYKGREQERDRLERDIFAAQRENRIVINA